MNQDWIKNIDKTWTLFLDRDGVINIEKEDDYIRSVSEWKFIDGVLEAFQVFHQIFSHIIIVTNQRGIGKGLMSNADLHDIHQHMLEEIHSHGGSVSRIYYSSAIDDNDPNRKPNPGMALQARKDFNEIDFSRSLMVGNSMSDMIFGRSCGMRTVFILSEKPMVLLPDPLVDEVFPNLLSLAKALQKPGEGR